MSDIAQCAKCGESKELCDSVRVDGIKQPRYCKDCLMIIMRTGDESYNKIYWLLQIKQLDDTKTIERIQEVTMRSANLGA